MLDWHPLSFAWTLLAAFIPGATAYVSTPSMGCLKIPFEFAAPAYAPYASLGLGTPVQTVSCLLDIGTSDSLTVNSGGSSGPFFLDRYNPCGDYHLSYGQLSRVQFDYLSSFNALTSSTFSYNITSQGLTGSSFIWNQYQAVPGEWATDMLTLGNYSAEVVLGMLSTTNTTSCVIGLGPTNGEIAGKTFEERVIQPQYPNLIDVMANFIEAWTYTYSIWFNSSQQRGAVIMGGMDVTKFVGRLTLVPIVSYISSGNQVSHIPGTILSIRIMFHGMSVTYNPQLVVWNTTNTTTYDADADRTLATAVVPTSLSTLAGNGTKQKLQWTPALDMRTSVTVDLSTMELFSRLPADMVDEAADMLNLQWVDDLGLYASSCLAQGMFNFNLSGILIQVELQDVMVKASSLNITEFATNDGSDLCLLTVIPESSYSYVLGTGILRNVYTFIDLNLNVVGFAPLNHSSDPEHSRLVPYSYSDRSRAMLSAPGYTDTSLVRNIAATYYASGPVANQHVYVVNDGAILSPSSWLLWLFIYLL